MHLKIDKKFSITFPTEFDQEFFIYGPDRLYLTVDCDHLDHTQVVKDAKKMVSILNTYWDRFNLNSNVLTAELHSPDVDAEKKEEKTRDPLQNDSAENPKQRSEIKTAIGGARSNNRQRYGLMSPKTFSMGLPSEFDKEFFIDGPGCLYLTVDCDHLDRDQVINDTKKMINILNAHWDGFNWDSNTYHTELPSSDIVEEKKETKDSNSIHNNSATLLQEKKLQQKSGIKMAMGGARKRKISGDIPHSDIVPDEGSLNSNQDAKEEKKAQKGKPSKKIKLSPERYRLMPLPSPPVATKPSLKSISGKTEKSDATFNP